ncbi:MAG: beta-lactamase family protein [Oscillospiraceae bacterium]|nr:beta-lactamase family protein [Oscillospiraceae bacterium]
MIFTQGKTDCTPSDVAYNADRLTVLNNHLQSGIDAGEIQCAMYCLSRQGKVFAHAGIGKKSFRAEDNTPVQPDSVRWIASVTKTFTAVAIMKLVEDGLARLDQSVGEILPQFNTPPYNQINIFNLLTHTSGLQADGGCFENRYNVDYWATIQRCYKLHDFEKDGEFDWISAALNSNGGMRVSANKEWAYCSFGFTILGAIIEKLTGIHSHKYIEDMICKPLGMKDTVFPENITSEMVKRHIISDIEDEKQLNDQLNDIINDVSENAGEKPTNPFDIYNIPHTGGGLLSTAQDMVRFGNMVLNRGSLDGVRILGRKAVEKMTELSVQLPDYCWGAGGAIRKYAIGFDHRNGVQFTFSDVTVMHEGAGACALYIDPQEELVAAWVVPLARDDWFPRIQYNTQNIIWSGLE